MKFKRLAAVIISAVTAFGAIGCSQTSSQSEPVAEENGENSSIAYTLGENGRPRVLYTKGDTIDIYVFSSPRMGGTDLSQVKVRIENRTSKKMRIAVTGDDDARPRFVVESRTGDVEILK